MTWTPDEELAFDVRMALSKIAGLRLSPEAREQAAIAIVEHLKLCRWRFERPDAPAGHGGPKP